MENYETGSAISFGGYTWRVLDIKNNAALIITENIIEQYAYHDVYKDTTWADCSLRKYLNGEFYGKFNTTDKSRIIPVKNKNADNQWYGTKGGADTQDSIFLLSTEEAACKYFGDSSAILHNRGKNQKYWFGKKDENNERRIARYDGESWGSWWWLRSSGRVSHVAVYIHGNGHVGINGNNISNPNGGIRPALWLKL